MSNFSRELDELTEKMNSQYITYPLYKLYNMLIILFQVSKY